MKVIDIITAVLHQTIYWLAEDVTEGFENKTNKKTKILTEVNTAEKYKWRYLLWVRIKGVLAT